MDRLSNGTQANPAEMTSVMQALTDLTRPKEDFSMLAGNVQASQGILEGVVSYNEKFNAVEEVNDENVEVNLSL